MSKAVFSLALAFLVPLASLFAGPSVGSVGLARGSVQVNSVSTDQVFPAWSNDGKRIAWLQRKAAQSGTFNLFVKTVGTADSPLQLTRDADNASAYSSPIWSPDNRFIGFVTTDGFYRTASLAGSGVSTSVIFGTTCLRGGTGRVPLAGRQYLVERRGSNIAFMPLNADGTFANTGDTFVTAFDSSVSIGDVRVTPDYSKVIFTVNSGTTSRVFALTGVHSIVARVSLPPTNLSSSSVVALTNGSSFDALGGPDIDASLVFVSSTGSYTPRPDCVPNSDNPSTLFGARNFEVGVVAGDGSGSRAAISGLSSVQNEVFPAISPDGMRLAFVRDDGISFQLFTADLAFRATIASQGGIRVATDGSNTTVTLPNGALPNSTDIFLSAPLTIPDAAGATLPAGVRPIVTARDVASTGGITLAFPATVRFSYLPGQISGLAESTLAAFFFNGQTQRWELVGGTVDTANKQVVFQTSRLGTFGLAGMLPATNSPTPGGGGGSGGGGGCALDARAGAGSTGTLAMFGLLLAGLARRRTLSTSSR